MSEILKKQLSDAEAAGRRIAKQLFEVEKERDTLAAKLKELKGQEPVAWMPDDAIIKLRSGEPKIVLSGVPCYRYEGMGTSPIFARPVPAEPVNARLVEALHSTIDLLWLEDSHSVEFDGTVMFGPSYDFSVLDRRIEFLWPGLDCIVWPGSGLNGKWSAYCTYEGSLWFEKFETKEQAKEQCLRLLDQVMPNHPVSKARAAIAAAIAAIAAEAQQAEPVCLTCGGEGAIGGWRHGEGYDQEPCPDCTKQAEPVLLMEEEIHGVDKWLEDAPFWRVVKFARAIEAAVLRKQGYKVEG